MRLLVKVFAWHTYKLVWNVVLIRIFWHHCHHLLFCKKRIKSDLLFVHCNLSLNAMRSLKHRTKLADATGLIGSIEMVLLETRNTQRKRADLVSRKQRIGNTVMCNIAHTLEQKSRDKTFPRRLQVLPANSDQPVHPISQIRVFAWTLWASKDPSHFRRTVHTLIKLRGCAGWSESSLGAHAILNLLLNTYFLIASAGVSSERDSAKSLS